LNSGNTLFKLRPLPSLLRIRPSILYYRIVSLYNVQDANEKQFQSQCLLHEHNMYISSIPELRFCDVYWVYL